mgnify:CR=1 FL=1|jgi:hypothetical protein
MEKYKSFLYMFVGSSARLDANTNQLQGKKKYIIDFSKIYG